MRLRLRPSTALRLAGAVIALSRLARAARRVPPVRAGGTHPGTDSGTHSRTPATTISVVVPARDEAARIGPLLAAVVGAPGVHEVVVVDDRSSDGTATVAAGGGARVVQGSSLPGGWTGKAWALQQGIEAAVGDWVVALDADTRPDPRLPVALVTRADADCLDLLTAAGRFECPTRPLQVLHPAMLTTLVYRFGPPGAATDVAPHRAMANGQCMVMPRRAFLAAGGMAPVAAHPVEDVALARHVATLGGRVGFLDATELLEVRMYESLRDAWSGWRRSLALPGVEAPMRQLVDLAVVAIAQVSPLPRLLLRRGDALDVVLLAARLGTLAGTASAYRPPRPAYWLSPLADGAALFALAAGVVSRRQTWRGREYAVPSTRPSRTAGR